VFFHASIPPVSAPAPTIQSEQTSEPPAALPQEQPAEIDLSSDWESDLSVETPEADVPQVEVPHTELPVMAQATEPEPEIAVPPPPPPAVNLEDGIEEVRFYLGQGMTDHAETALAKLEALAPGSPELAVLRLGIESAKQQAGNQAASGDVTVEEAMPSYGAPVVEEAPASSASVPQPWPQEPPRAAEPPVLQQMVSELEQSLGSGFLPEAEPPKPELMPVAEATPSADQQFRSGTLDEFVSDLEASLGNDFSPEAPVEQTAIPVAQVKPPVARAEVGVPLAPAARSEAPVARAAAASAMPMSPASTPVPPPVVHQPTMAAASSASAIDIAPGVDLADMFGELKHELEEDTAAADEDPETHYNLGVAFREMGLLDEAIGEFQKVCQAAEHGRAFSQIMQTYTWLAQCFLDKGIPEAAIRWYEQALKLPSLDQETRTALHYELASSFENAGNKSAALSNFLEVYGSNIDYRDVGERIKALRP
jgi:hypothetical protein